METDPMADLPCRIDIQPQVVLFHLVYGAAEIINAVTEHIPKPGVLCRPCPVVHVEIHIVCRRDPAGQIFHECQLGEPVETFASELPFRRKHLVKQPFIQL